MQKIFSQELRFKADDGSEFPEWVEKKLGEVCDVIDGDRGINYPMSEDFNSKGYCLFLSAKNVTKNGFIFDEMNFISREKDFLMSKGKLIKNDIVLTTRGTVGNFAYFNEYIKFNDIRINSGMVILRCKEKVDSLFLYKLSSSHKISDYIKKISFGSAQPQLTVKEIKKIKIQTPCRQEQTKIANFLSAIDEDIDLLESQLAELELQKKGLMQGMFV